MRIFFLLFFWPSFDTVVFGNLICHKSSASTVNRAWPGRKYFHFILCRRSLNAMDEKRPLCGLRKWDGAKREKKWNLSALVFRHRSERILCLEAQAKAYYIKSDKTICVRFTTTCAAACVRTMLKERNARVSASPFRGSRTQCTQCPLLHAITFYDGIFVFSFFQ